MFEFVILENSDFPESEYLRRELKINLTKIKMESPLPNPVFIATQNPMKIENYLKNANEKQIVLLWLGNETYDINIYKMLEENSIKILHLFLAYTPRIPKFKNWIMLILGSTLDLSFFFRWGSVKGIRVLKNGFDLIRRTKQIRFGFEMSPIPLGYTNAFVEQLKYLQPKIENYDSLFDLSLYESEVGRQIDISFVGKEGEWARHVALSVLMQNDLIKIVKIKTLGWGGHQFEDLEYVNSLLESKFVLCPPGHISNQSFRYFESLLLGALPISTPNSLQDPHIGNFWTEEMKSFKFYSWKYICFYIKNVSDNERKGIIGREVLRIQNDIAVIRQVLSRLNLNKY